jgi:predicted nucleotidyltransferase
MKGGKADKLTLPQIAKKHGVPIEDLMSQFKLGIKTEMEHTDNKKQAKEIASDHLAENPKYYTKLKKAKLEEAIAKSLVTAALGLGLMGNPSVSKGNQAIPIAQQQQQNQDKLPKKVSFSRSESISNPDLDLVHGALGSKRLKEMGELDFSQVVNNELKKQFNQGKKADVSNIKISTYVQGNQIITEASCDIVESTDGIAYTEFTTRGSIGSNYERRHDEQVDGLVDRLKNKYGVAKQLDIIYNNEEGDKVVDKSAVITFKIGGRDVSYKQSFFVASDSKQPQMQQSQQPQTISGKDFADLRQKLKDQTKDISIDLNSIEIDMDNYSVSYKLGDEKIKVISLIYDNAGQLETRLISVKNQNPTLEVLEKGKSGNVDWAVSIILADEILKENLNYPIELKRKKKISNIGFGGYREHTIGKVNLSDLKVLDNGIEIAKNTLKNDKTFKPSNKPITVGVDISTGEKQLLDGYHRYVSNDGQGIMNAFFIPMKNGDIISFDEINDSSIEEEALPKKLKSDIEIEYHKNLNPQFWLNNHLKSGIRKNLLNLAKFYFKQLDLGVELKDVIFTGSLANYNYTNLSDVDLHLIIDYKKLTNDDEFAKEFFSNKRSIWADSNEIKVNGFPVEIYVQDVSELDDKGMGSMYSLLNNKWIKKPKYKLPQVEKHLITTKVNKYLDILNKISMMDDSIKKVEAYNKVFEKMRTDRKKATQKEGEFSVDNLVFKVLRNKGVFDIIKNNKKEIVNNLFSMKTN